MNRTGKINYIIWFITPLLALMVFGLTRLFIRYPELAENYYSQNIYPLMAAAVSSFSRWIPVSLDDILYLVLILVALIIVVLLIARKISLKFSALLVMNALALVYVLFYFLWGFNYFRVDINTRLEMAEHEANPEEFMEVFHSLTEATNHSYTTYETFDKDEIALLIEESYEKLAPLLRLKYPAGTRRAKPITFSNFFAQAGISGYFGPFFCER